jgi:hypothetical protein
MSVSVLSRQHFIASASPSSSAAGKDLPFGVSHPGQLPDMTPFITPYLLKTLEMLHRVHGPSPHIEALSRHLSYQYHLVGIPRPTTALEVYSMKYFTDQMGLPHTLPFISDDCAQIIPFSAGTKSNHGVMEDIIEAIRRTTCLTQSDGKIVFYPPTTGDIQTYLSSRWATKYPSTNNVASGWRNTVNQCLTHGQGWNFLTFPPIDGTKNKRHLLFERAYNASYIVGSGQCKGLNDLKPKSRPCFLPRNTISTPPPSSTSEPDLTTSPEPPSSFSLSPTPEPTSELKSAFSMEVGGMDTSWCMCASFDKIYEREPGMQDPYLGLETAEANLSSWIHGGDGPIESSRTLEEVEAELMGMLGMKEW